MQRVPLGWLEEVVAPRQGGSHALVAGWKIASATRQQRQRAIDAGMHITQADHPQSGRRQFDRKWHSIEANTDVAHECAFVVAVDESGIGLACPRREQRHRRRGHRVGRQWRQPMLDLDAQPQQCAARREHREQRAAGQQIANHRNGLRQMLHIVEHQEQRARSDRPDNRVAHRCPANLNGTNSCRDLGEHEVSVVDPTELHEERFATAAPEHSFRE